MEDSKQKKDSGKRQDPNNRQDCLLEEEDVLYDENKGEREMSVDVSEFIFTVWKVGSSAERKTNSGKDGSWKTVENTRNKQ